MFIVNICIASGVVYAGIKTFIKHRPKRTAAWLTEPVHQNAKISGAETDKARFLSSESLHEKKFQQNFAISSVSLGLSMSGALIYPPLGVASVPLNVYTSIPVFEKAFDVFLRKRQGKMVIVNSLVMIGSMATEHYFLASLYDWLRHYLTLLARRIRDFNQYFSQEWLDNYRLILVHYFSRPPQSVWVVVDGLELETPFEELEIGNVVVAREGEFVPVDGRVVEGSALVNRFLLMRDPRAVEIREGDYVSALTVVQSGRICVRVEKVR